MISYTFCAWGEKCRVPFEEIFAFEEFFSGCILSCFFLGLGLDVAHVAPNYITKVSPSLTCRDYFKELKINYLGAYKDAKVRENFEQYTIVCRDLWKFFDLILQNKLLESSESLPIKVGVDGGGGFLKIYLSVFDMEYLISSSKVSLP